MPAPETSWISIADTAVKIGLGALISGIFGWLIAKHNSKSVVDKLMFERRSNTLSDVAHAYETFFQAYLKFSNRLVGINNTNRTCSPPTADEAQLFGVLITNSLNEAVRFRQTQMERMEDSFFAQSKLMLLGEKDCQQKGEALHMAIAHADQSFKFDGRDFDLTNFETLHKGVATARQEFYKAMEKAFGRK